MEERNMLFNLDTTDGLQAYFFKKHTIANIEQLQGGYTSSVFRADLDGHDVVIKHARAREIFYPVHSVDSITRASTEVDVLQKLTPIFHNEVPNVIEYTPEDNMIIMTDVGQDATLGFSYFMSGRAEVHHAEAMGNFLARLKQSTSDWEPFVTTEKSFEQIWTRGLEVDLASEKWGTQLRDYYLKPQKFVWVDGHPKNVFFGDKEPYVRAIDWDCSHFADSDYMLPNFFGQIPIFTTFEHVKLQDGLKFISSMIQSYGLLENISPEVEAKMCFYAGCQMLQRQDGKWLFDACGGTDDLSLKRKSYLFYASRRILTSVKTFDQYLNVLKEGSWF